VAPRSSSGTDSHTSHTVAALEAVQVAGVRAEHAVALDDAARRETAERLGATHIAELDTLRARAEVDLARAEGVGELAEARSTEVTRLVAQVEDLRAELGRARDETRRLQGQLDRHSTPPAEPAATAAGSTRRSRPRAN